MKSRRDYDSTEFVLELSRSAMRLSLEELQTLLYDLEHTAPMSAECALVRAFVAWRKQLEQLRYRQSSDTSGV
jgi:hypothetical protein